MKCLNQEIENESKKIHELQGQGDTLCQGHDIANAKKAI